MVCEVLGSALCHLCDHRQISLGVKVGLKTLPVFLGFSEGLRYDENCLEPVAHIGSTHGGTVTMFFQVVEYLFIQAKMCYVCSRNIC